MSRAAARVLATAQAPARKTGQSPEATTSRSASKRNWRLIRSATNSASAAGPITFSKMPRQPRCETLDEVLGYATFTLATRCPSPCNTCLDILPVLSPIRTCPNPINALEDRPLVITCQGRWSTTRASRILPPTIWTQIITNSPILIIVSLFVILSFCSPFCSD